MRAVSLLLSFLTGCTATVAPAPPSPTASAFAANSRAEASDPPPVPASIDVSVLSCELVRPTAFEQVLPDGHVAHSPESGGRSAARLQLEVVNPGPDAIHLAACHGVPMAKFRQLPGWCSAPGSETTLRLGSGERLTFYLTLKAVVPDHPVTDTLNLLIGNNPSMERMTWTAASSPVSFVVDATGCSSAPVELQPVKPET